MVVIQNMKRGAAQKLQGLNYERMFLCSTDVTSISHSVIHSRFWHIRHYTTVTCCYILRFVYRCNHPVRIVQTYAACIAIQ